MPAAFRTTLHAVAAHDVARIDDAFAVGGAHAHARAVPGLLDGCCRNAPVHRPAERGQALRKYALGLILRQHQQVMVPGGQPVEAQLHERAVAVTDRELVNLQAASRQLFGDAELFQHFERMRVDHRGARCVLPLGQPVDDDVVHARLLERDSERHSGGAGANDENIGVRGQHGRFLRLSTYVDFLDVPIAKVNTCWQFIRMTKKTTAKTKKSEATQAAILAAARQLFAERGYDRTTIRDVAARAEIDPAMVIRYFGSKDDLFVHAADFDLKVPDIGAIDRAKMGEMLIRHFLELWEGENRNKSLPLLLRSAASNEYAARKVREVFASQVLPALARAGATSGAASRAALVSSQLLGLAFLRYVLKLPPVVQMSHDDIVRHVGRTLQRYVTGTD
jgi:AcrR family transcriptional regulator